MVARSGTMPAAGGQGSAAQVPWGWLGYAEVTANQTGIVAYVDATGLSQAVTVGTSRRIRVTGYVRAVSSSGGDNIGVKLMEGATQLVLDTTYMPPFAGATGLAHVSVVLTPSPGAHTYKVQIGRANGGGTLTLQASATQKCYLSIEDVGPAS